LLTKFPEVTCRDKIINNIPRRAKFGDQFYFGTVVDGVRFEVDSAKGIQSFDRNFFIQKYNSDARF
jgi:hypothetical protein